MQVKLFGDTEAIDWDSLGVKMPFAPLHHVAGRYELSSNSGYSAVWNYEPEDLQRTFELRRILNNIEARHLVKRITYRVNNTIAALDQCTPDTVCVNIGGGYHHAGLNGGSGYAYSLVNDLVHATNHQLWSKKTVGIIDLDFHFGGGTVEYYSNFAGRVAIFDNHHPKGILQKHIPLTKNFSSTKHLTGDPLRDYKFDKIVLNIGTDWYAEDELFGSYGQMLATDLLTVWKDTITPIVDRKIPLTITCGGGYGDKGSDLYHRLIEWLQAR